jgi:hypothetical protein
MLMRMLVSGPLSLALADLLAQKGGEKDALTVISAHTEPEFSTPPTDWMIHRDQPAPGRANLIPANLASRPKR